MFFIVNKTKSPVVIGDIEITLGPRQAMDLDKIMSRSKSEASKMLKAATKAGKIDVRIKDGGEPANFPATPNPNDSLDDMKNDLLAEMKKLMAQNNQPVQPQGVSREDLAAFAKQIVDNMPKPEVIHIHGESQDNIDDEEVEISEEMLGEIGQRAINKIVEGTAIESINCKEEKQDNSILGNIDELEGLL